MTHDSSSFDGESSRRSFLKHGALATGSVALGLSADAAAAQENETDGDGLGTDEDAGATADAGGDARLNVGSYHPGAAFAIVSGPIDWTLANGDAAGGTTHLVRYLNTGEVVPVVFGSDAQIGEYDEESGFVPADGGAAPGTPTPDEGLGVDNETVAGNETGNETGGGGGIFGGDNATGGAGVGNETGNATGPGNATGGAAPGTPGVTMGQTRPAVYEFGDDATIQAGGVVEVGFSSVDASMARDLLAGDDWWHEGGAAPGTPAEDEGLGVDNETVAGNETGNETGVGNETGNETGGGGGIFGGNGVLGGDGS